MADVGFRDLIGSFAPGFRTEPTVAPPPHDILSADDAAPQPAMVTPPPPPPLFGPDRKVGDGLGLEPTFARLAELVLHRRTGTPYVVGIGGAAGSGKSVALGRIAALAKTLAADAAAAPSTPFVSRLHVATVDAAALDGEPMLALAGKLHASLRGPYSDLARDIGQLARDPHATLRDCNDRLDDARRRLDGERRALDDAGSRRARLVESVLYESSGSAVDAFARANRASLERRFAGFGLGGDTLRTYKDFVLNAAGSGGQVSLALRALWAFKGQLKLIVLAILLVATGIGLGIALDTRDAWLADLRGGPQAGVGVANWLQVHLDLLSTGRTAAFVLAALCIAANLWRTVSFFRPIARGTVLLGSDLEGRRRDLDGLYAHATKRVDALELDVERLTREAGAAERRAVGLAEPSPFEPANAGAASALFASLAAATECTASGAVAAPERVLLVLDGLDGLTPDRALAVLSALKRGLGAGAIALVAFDPARFDTAATVVLERCIDLAVILSPLEAAETLVTRMLGLVSTPSASPRSAPATSAIDAPLDPGEAELLVAVAPLAGSTPRSTRRFLDLYRLARLDGDAPRGALAFALAMRLGATAEERDSAALAFGGSAGSMLPPAGGRLGRAHDAALDFDGGAPGEDALQQAERQARRFGLPASPSASR